MAISPSSVVFDDANGNSVVVTAANPLPMGGGVASGAADAGSPVKVGGVYNSAQPTLATGQRVDLQIAPDGVLRVRLSGQLATGADAINNGNLFYAGAYNGTPGLAVTGAYVFNGSTWDREAKPNTTARLLSSAASTNATSVKGSAGNVCKIFGNNTVAVKKYLKLYNKATAPTVGTDTPVLTFVIPVSAAFTFDLTSYGHYFSVGIAYAITGAAADADTTAIGAGDIECLNITYA